MALPWFKSLTKVSKRFLVADEPGIIIKGDSWELCWAAFSFVLLLTQLVVGIKRTTSNKIPTNNTHRLRRC